MASYVGRAGIFHTVKAYNDFYDEHQTIRESKNWVAVNLNPPFRLGFWIEHVYARNTTFKLRRDISWDDGNLGKDTEEPHAITHGGIIQINNSPIVWTDWYFYAGRVASSPKPFFCHMFIMQNGETTVPVPPHPNTVERYLELIKSMDEAK